MNIAKPKTYNIKNLLGSLNGLKRKTFSKRKTFNFSNG